MPPPSSTNGFVPTAAMLLNPKAYQKQVVNGIAASSSSHFSPASFDFLTARFESEPPSSPAPHYSFEDSYLPKDDTYLHKGRVKTKSHGNSNGESQGRVATYDPRQLLNPKGYQKKDKEVLSLQDWSDTMDAFADETSSTPQGGTQHLKRDFENVEGKGMGSLIETLHGVEKRERRPQKKVKLDKVNEDQDDQKRAIFAGGGSGELRQYLKQQQANRNGAGSLIDLTADDADNDVEIVKSNDVGDQEVCYGRIEAAVSAHKVPKPKSKANFTGTESWPPMKLRLHREPGKNSVIRVFDPCDQEFGNVIPAIATALAPVMDSTINGFHLQAHLTMRRRKANEWPGTPCSDQLRMTINVYGRRKIAESIGKHFKKYGIFFVSPALVDPGVPTVNPHAGLRGANPSSAFGATSISKQPGSYESITAEETHTAVVKMFDSLSKSSEKLPEMEPESLITTPLLRHQKQALHFMTEKEKPRNFGDNEDDNSSLWRVIYRQNGQKTYRDVLSGLVESKEPPQCLGGLLADEMGLGKTLSILSLAISTMTEAQLFEKVKPPPQNANEWVVKRNCKTTLLVSPLTAVKNWEEQLEAHLKTGSFSYCLYHGPNRCRDPDQLAKYDMVITTYATIFSDATGRGSRKNETPLNRLNFFRIVLDEAHNIRQQTTGQAKAIYALAASRRWAVTGTPIQNRLDDLGSLTKFLKLYPYDEKVHFSNYIVKPFKAEDPRILKALPVLVASFTLRRLKTLIDLPERKEFVTRLDFNAEEKRLHDFFQKQSTSDINLIDRVDIMKKRRGKDRKVQMLMIQGILTMRKICGHGKEMLNPDELEKLKGHSAQDAIDLDDEDEDVPSLSERTGYEKFVLQKESSMDLCRECGTSTGDISAEEDSEGNESPIGYILPCYEILCRDCFAKYKEAFDKSAGFGRVTKCKFCDRKIAMSYTAITQSGLEEFESSEQEAKMSRKRIKELGEYGGPSTKAQALITALKQNMEESALFPDEPPVKSVVFSEFTKNLDLIEIALEDNGIGFVRLDGSMTLPNRAKTLNAFKNDPSKLVLSASLKAGGVGLNLTAASKVYLMEPLWNPMAEAQAVDRIHRMGQKREVTVTRFIINDSVDNYIEMIQKIKIQLANVSMDRGRSDGKKSEEELPEVMKSLRKLFK